MALEPSTCGGLERAVCLRLEDARWIEADGVEHAWAIGNASLTAHAQSVAPGSCDDVVPTRQASWGAIKAHFR